MNSITKYLFAAAMGAITLTACSDNNDTPDPDNGADKQEEALKAIVNDYVDCTVIPTYRGLADASINLANACDAMLQGGVEGLTPAKINAAGNAWLEARRYWELSEAWLFGAAADYNIDPHIDTWPLDNNAMEALLRNSEAMAMMHDRESAGEYVGSSLGQGLLGFHAIEYMLFEPRNTTTATTSPRPAERFTINELFYLAAVADDLRNCCLRLEASWAGADATDATKLAILDAAELGYDKNYGLYMKNAGGAGSIYVNYAEAVEEMIVGAQDIADELGNQKIGNPVGSGLEADPDYIESPYALNSITDFADNLLSVRHAYMGYDPAENPGEKYLRTPSHTLSAYVAGLDTDLDSRVRAALDKADAAVAAMREPFASTSQQAEMHNVNFAAVDACNDLKDIFDEVLELIRNSLDPVPQYLLNSRSHIAERVLTCEDGVYFMYTTDEQGKNRLRDALRCYYF